MSLYRCPFNIGNRLKELVVGYDEVDIAVMNDFGQFLHLAFTYKKTGSIFTRTESISIWSPGTVFTSWASSSKESSIAMPDYPAVLQSMSRARSSCYSAVKAVIVAVFDEFVCNHDAGR